MKQIIYFALSVCFASTAQAQTCNSSITRSAPDSRYELVVGSGGSELLDKQTGLIWQRCSLGQSWSGSTCTGTASVHTWTDALAKAKAVGNGYRVPSIKELRSLTETACSSPTINGKFFPNTVSNKYWSASPDVGNNNGVWLIDFSYGHSNGNNKLYDYYVRAVRAGQ